MKSTRRKWRVTVGKFDPTVWEDQPERYFVGIEYDALLGKSWERIAVFWRRGHAERFASMIREDPKP